MYSTDEVEEATGLAKSGRTEDLENWIQSRGTNAVNVKDAYGSSLCQLAVMNKRFDTLSMLLNNCANIHSKDSKGDTVIITSSWWCDRVDIMEKLIAYGANINDRNLFQDSPLTLACSQGYTGIVKLLLSSGADCNAETYEKGTPLISACYNHHLHIVHLLVEAGSSLDQINPDGNSLLHISFLKGDENQNQWEIAGLLVALQVDANIKNNEGKTVFDLIPERMGRNLRTPLHYPCRAGIFRLVESLISKSIVGLDDVDSAGNTALHEAVKSNDLAIITLLLSHGASSRIVNQNGLVAMHLFSKDGTYDAVLAVLLSDFPLDEHGAIKDFFGSNWTALLDSSTLIASKTKINVLKYIFSRYPYQVKQLVTLKDVSGREAIEITDSSVRSYINRRYRLFEERPEHISATCFVFKAVDEMHLDDKGAATRVALKLMRRRDQFEREIEVRQCGFDSNYVLEILRTHIPLEKTEQASNLQVGVVTLTKEEAEQFYCIVMPLAERNLFVALKQERFAGRILDEVKFVFNQLLTSVLHMHSKGFIHGDLKPLNCVRLRGCCWQLIDLDASCRIGVDYVCAKYSSAYIPPECIDSNSIYEPMHVSQNTVLAAVSFDIWSLGVILYQLCSTDAIPLFLSGQDDNLRTDWSDDDNLHALCQWSEETKVRKLSKVSDPLAKNLISLMLSKSPERRPSIIKIRMHPFLSGKTVARLSNEKAKYQVFISYRVNSDSVYAEHLYDVLTTANIKVFWDKKSLRMGERWKDDFCAALVSTDIFLCIISRNAINHPTSNTQNYSKLTASSSVDNVLLEHRLALELRDIGYIKKICPIFIGDINDIGAPLAAHVAGNFFASGCLPTAPLTHVTSVERELWAIMESQALGTPITTDKTVASIVKDLCACQGRLIEGLVIDALNTAAEDIISTAEEITKQEEDLTATTREMQSLKEENTRLKSELESLNAKLNKGKNDIEVALDV